MSKMYFLKPGLSAEDYEQMARDMALHKLGLLKWEDEEFEDCLVSDRGADLLIRIYRMLAELARTDGRHPLPVLKTLDGQPVKAKVIFDRFDRPVWAVMDEENQVTAFFPYKPARAEILARYGYMEVEEEVPAAVRLMGEGGGKDGLAGMYPAIVMDTRRKKP